MTKKVKAAPVVEKAALTLPLKASVPVPSIEDYKWLVHGFPGVGKTSLVAQWPDNLLLDVDDGARALKVRKVVPHTWDEMCGYVDLLLEGSHDVSTVIVDTAERAYLMLAEQVCRENNVSAIGQIAHGRGYEDCNRRFYLMLEALKQSGRGVVLVSHSRLIKISRGVQDITRAVPDFSDSARRVIMGWVDMCLFLYSTEEADKEGDLKYMRHLRCSPSLDVEAKGRISHMPDELDLPSAKEGFKLLEKAFAEAVKLTLKE